MSKVKCVVDTKAVGDLLRSAEMAACIKAEADSRAAGLGAGYAADSKVLKTRAVSSIYTETAEAAADNSRNNSLLKAVGR